MITDQRKTKRNRKKEFYTPVAASAAAEPHPLSPLHPAASFGRRVPDLSGRQEVHHRLFGLFYCYKLGNLHVPASARFPACCLSLSLAECLLLVVPSAAVAEEVLPRLGHSPSTPPVFIVISVAKPLWVDSSGCMPGLQSVERGGQRLYACDGDRAFGPHRALESVPEVLAALVGLPLRFGCRPLLGDSSSPIRSRSEWPLYHCSSACVSGQVRLTVCLVVSGDAGVSRHPLDVVCDVMSEETPRPSVDPPRQSLPSAGLQLCRSSN